MRLAKLLTIEPGKIRWFIHEVSKPISFLEAYMQRDKNFLSAYIVHYTSFQQGRFALYPRLETFLVAVSETRAFYINFSPFDETEEVQKTEVEKVKPGFNEDVRGNFLGLIKEQYVMF